MRSYYQNTIEVFIADSFKNIWADLTGVGRGDLLNTQKEAKIAIFEPSTRENLELMRILKDSSAIYLKGYGFWLDSQQSDLIA